jgi:hypothetical protein
MLPSLGKCYILPVYLQSTLMMVERATEICRRILIYVGAYFRSVHFMVYYISVNIS